MARGTNKQLNIKYIYLALVVCLYIYFLLFNKNFITSQLLVGAFNTTPSKIVYLFLITLFATVLPVTGVVLWPIAALAYNRETAFLLTFLGNFIGGVINYFLVSAIGKPAFLHIVGVKNGKRVDKIAKKINTSVIFSVIFGFLSYKYTTAVLGFSKFNKLIFLAATLSFLLWLFGVFYVFEFVTQRAI